MRQEKLLADVTDVISAFEKLSNDLTRASGESEKKITAVPHAATADRRPLENELKLLRLPILPPWYLLPRRQ